MVKKYFTLKEANELLPELEIEVRELQQLRKTFKEKLVQLNRLKEATKYQITTEVEEVFTRESELDFMELQAELHLRNIESTGAQFKSIDMGLLDFPARLNEQDILLCWKIGESEITHYHGENEGFSGRKPLN
ncbi:DUF2203 domain-containing protein [Bacillus solitudinis]|uniref:DUF2203 domain-containing protein n=1 Tax=Bacillus solitudinis TaxID=2014074 RepID=UPI000C235B08|nr:DUF2203 domain-containing protein [Bacillus solitudinis]